MWYKSIESWKMFHHIFCNNCLEFRRFGEFFFFFLEVKTWKVKCYSLPFSLLPICNGKNLHRIEHTKRIKQGQDCQKVIATKSLRIYINIFIYHYCFLVFDLLDSFNLENVWYRSLKSWKMFHHVFCNNCLEFRSPRKFFYFHLFVCLFFFPSRSKDLES